MAGPSQADSLTVVTKLLRETANKAEIEELLRTRGAPFSGTWDVILNRRIPEALDSKRLGLEDLTGLLADAEENGRQHVFLYRCTSADAATYLDPTRIAEVAESRGTGDLISSPRLLDMPATPTLTDVRLVGSGTANRSLLLKEVTTREQQGPMQSERVGNELRIVREITQVRAVNVLRLHTDGLLEVRVFSQAVYGGRSAYDQLALELRQRYADFIPIDGFSQYVITNAKNALYQKRGALADDVRHSAGAFVDAFGNIVTYASGRLDRHLWSSTTVESSAEAFIASDGNCAESTIHVRGADSADGRPHWVAVRLAGADNEFVLSSQCSGQDYDRVLRLLRQNNA
jgi:hypothetical protein